VSKVQWGVLGAAGIAINRVIPAMNTVSNLTVVGIASRDLGKAREAASKAGVEKAYGSYEALLADPAIEAVYIPLPNHMHIEWCVKALEAGKHVLCEKPISMNAKEAEVLIEARNKSGKIIEEAFAIRNHPQWAALRQVIDSGEIGAVRGVQTVMCYNNRNPNDIRNRADVGGGALYDVGSYAVTGSRMAFNDEPTRAMGLFDIDPAFGTDRLTSIILEFPA
jgi:predicted dehydrogenase